MKGILAIISITTLFLGCSTHDLVTKPWHTSPSRDPRTSTAYPSVEWPVVQKLTPGMPVSEAKALVHELQSYHHPVNAIVFSTYQGRNCEVALKISKDKTTIEDISYKILDDNAEQKATLDKE